MKISTMITKGSVTVNFDGRTHSIPVSDPAYAKMVDAIRVGDERLVRSLVNKAAAVVSAGNSTSNASFQVVDGQILIDGRQIHGELATQILEFVTAGLPFQPLVNFYRKLKKNPSERSVSDLFAFLAKNQHPITESGNFIAYKRVRPADSQGRMLDIHSGTFDNRPGSFLSMPREKVDPDPTRTCSTGLHVANWDYAANRFGGPSDVMIEVEVNPGDVVAVPTDYNQSKMRVCGYVVRSLVVNPNQSKHLVTESTPPSAGPSKLPVPVQHVADHAHAKPVAPPVAPAPKVTAPAASHPAAPQTALVLHDEASLRRMSSARLRGYVARLVAVDLTDATAISRRAKVLVMARAILKGRR